MTHCQLSSWEQSETKFDTVIFLKQIHSSISSPKYRPVNFNVLILLKCESFQARLHSCLIRLNFLIEQEKQLICLLLIGTFVVHRVPVCQIQTHFYITDIIVIGTGTIRATWNTLNVKTLRNCNKASWVTHVVLYLYYKLEILSLTRLSFWIWLIMAKWIIPCLLSSVAQLVIHRSPDHGRTHVF